MFDLRLAICTAFAGMVIALDETGHSSLMRQEQPLGIWSLPTEANQQMPTKDASSIPGTDNMGMASISRGPVAPMQQGPPVMMPPMVQRGPGQPMPSNQGRGPSSMNLPPPAPAEPGDPFAGATCVVPMWNKQEFLCQEHVDIPDEETLEDLNGVKRKTMHDGATCTTQCPHARWWQAPTHEELTCKDGSWRDDTGRVAQELVCDTRNLFYFTTLLVLVIIIFLCTPGGRKSFRQAFSSRSSPASPTSPTSPTSPKADPGAEVKKDEPKVEKAEAKEGESKEEKPKDAQ